MSNKVTIGLQEVTLRWYVIDDNLKNYAIYINNSIWKNATVESNLIEVKFSNSVGLYNITLEVTDFSNNTANYKMVINVSQSTSSSQSSATESNISTSYSGTKASSGFSFIEFLIGFMSLIVGVYYLRFKRRK